jgi:drug/metabolite transporter (DMT)-like permease
MKKKSILNIKKSLIKNYIAIGLVIGIHWYCFYGAVKLSHVSVALMCMALTTFFTTILEPIMLKTTFNKTNFIISILIIPLMYWMINGVKDLNILGFIVGIAAALFAAIFSILNKTMVTKDIDEELMAFYEFIGVLIFCMPMAIYLFIQDGLIAHSPIDLKNLGLIVCLSLLCTNLAFLVSLFSLKKLSIFESNLIIGLEPVYGILIAYFILDESQYLNLNFYLSAFLILLLIILNPTINRIMASISK